MAHCDICNLNLNSVEQLVQHKTGKTHHKNLAIKNGDIPTSTVCSKQKGNHVIGNQRQQIMFVKAGLTEERQEPKSSSSLEPLGFDIDPERDTYQPGEEVVVGRKRKAQSSYCNYCQKELNSDLQASQHYASDKHMKRLKMGLGTETNTPGTSVKKPSPKVPPVPKQTTTDITPFPDPPAYLSTSPPPPPPPPPVALTKPTTAVPGSQEPPKSTTVVRGSQEPPKATHGFMFCSFCNLSLNSASQIDAHRSGARHKKNVAKAQSQQLSTVTSTTKQ